MKTIKVEEYESSVHADSPMARVKFIRSDGTHTISTIPREYIQVLVDYINNPTPDEPAGEWRVDISYEDMANGEVWPVRPCDDVVNIPVCLCLDKETAERIVRDHNRKYDPADVGALIEEWKNKTPLMFGEAAKWSRRMDVLIAKLKGSAE